MSARRYRRLTPGPAAEATDVAEAAVSDSFGMRVFSGITGALFLIGSVLFFIGDLGSVNWWGSQQFAGATEFRVGHFFNIGTFILGLLYLLGSAPTAWWADTVDQVHKRARWSRWTAHFFALPAFVMGVTALLYRTNNAAQATVLALVAVIAALSSYVQSSNEHMNSDKNSQSEGGPWANRQYGIEGILSLWVAYIVTGAFLWVLGASTSTSGWNVYLPIVFAILYGLYLVYVTLVVNVGMLPNSPWLREGLFIAFIWVVVLWVHIAVYVGVPLVAPP